MFERYEYKVLKARSLVPQEQMNEFGKEGWELTSIIHDNGFYYFYLKRGVLKQ